MCSTPPIGADGLSHCVIFFGVWVGEGSETERMGVGGRTRGMGFIMKAHDIECASPHTDIISNVHEGALTVQESVLL